MSSQAAACDVAGFVAAVLMRAGGLAEVDGEGAIACVLPRDVQIASRLPEFARLRVLAAPGGDETALPLESASMRWCVESALAHGRFAAATLPGVRPKASGIAEQALAQFSAINGTVRAVGTRTARFHAWLLEFRYEAIGDERSEGSLYVAYEQSFNSLSAPLAQALIPHIGSAEPMRSEFSARALTSAAAVAGPHVLQALSAKVGPLRANLQRRLERDARRLFDYHDTLLRENSKRQRGSMADDARAALDAKAAAVTRQRDEKLRELVQRYSVEVRYSLASILDLSYPVAVCDARLIRRRRELALALPWDPFLRAVPPIACPTCSRPSLAYHVCDEAGHMSCSACAAACVACARVTCRACHPQGCRICTPSGPGASA